jgi:hypothetical protein
MTKHDTAGNLLIHESLERAILLSDGLNSDCVYPSRHSSLQYIPHHLTFNNSAFCAQSIFMGFIQSPAVNNNEDVVCFL